MESKLYIVLAGYNDYDQHGDYFVSASSKKPTIEEFAEICNNYLGITNKKESFFDEKALNSYYQGNGRLSTEDIWFKLIEIQENKIFSITNLY